MKISQEHVILIFKISTCQGVWCTKAV